MEKVKILQDRKICFDGIKRTSLKKGDSFEADKKQVKILTSVGVILDPTLDKKEAQNKREEILNQRAEELKNSKGSKKIKVSTAPSGKIVLSGKTYSSFEDAKADLEEQLEAFEAAQVAHEESVKAFDEEKEAFLSENPVFAEEYENIEKAKEELQVEKDKLKAESENIEKDVEKLKADKKAFKKSKKNK